MTGAVNTTTELWQVIRRTRTIDHSKPHEYTWAAEEAGKQLAALAPQSNNALIAPQITKATREDKETKEKKDIQNYYLRGVTEAVKKFQELMGLTSNGEITDKTARAIRALYREVVVDGKDFDESVAVVKEEIKQPLGAAPAPAPKPEVEPHPDAEKPEEQAPAPDAPPPDTSSTDVETIPIGKDRKTPAINVTVAKVSRSPGASSDVASDLTPAQREQFVKDEVLLNKHTTVGSQGVFAQADYARNPEHYHEVVKGILNLPQQDQRKYLEGVGIGRLQPGVLGLTRRGDVKIFLNSDALKTKRPAIISWRDDKITVSKGPHNSIFPPEYTVAHEFAHLLTFNKWYGDQRARLRPKLQYLEQAFSQSFIAAEDAVMDALQRGAVQNRQQVIDLVSRFFPSPYVASYVLQSLTVESEEEYIQIQESAYCEFLAELYAQSLLAPQQFAPAGQQRPYESALAVMKELIADGGQPCITANPLSIYNSYRASTQSSGGSN